MRCEGDYKTRRTCITAKLAKPAKPAKLAKLAKPVKPAELAKPYPPVGGQVIARLHDQKTRRPENQ